MANEKTTELSDMLKGLQEVSTLGGNDRLLAIDADGEIKKLNNNFFITETFVADKYYDLIILGETSSDYGIFGTVCMYRRSGHVSMMMQLRSGDSTPNWHQHSMIVHPDMRYPNLYDKISFVKCTYLGRDYNAIRVPQCGTDMDVVFYGVVRFRSKMFGKLLASSEVSDIVDITSLSKVTLQTSLPSISGGGNFLQFNALLFTERRGAA